MDTDRIAAEIERLRIPGVALGVLQDGEPRSWCWGVTSVDHPLPVTDTTLFQLASISKTFVGTVAMVLVDQGRLDLDEPIGTYVPDVTLPADGVTTRHLLTHYGGWVGDYFLDTGNGAEAMAAFVAKLRKAPQLTPPGSVYSYSNSAFNLAAYVVQTIADMPYETAVREWVLRPLGMRTTTYWTDEAITRRVAIGHRNGKVQVWRRARAHAGVSGVLSCSADMLTYAQFNLGDGSPVMSASALAELHRPCAPAGCFSDDIALVWRLDSYAGHSVWHHGGTSNGYESDIRIVPDLGLAWVLLTNGEHSHQLDAAVMEALLGPPAAWEPFVPVDLAAYCGHYEAALFELEVVIDGDHLRIDASVPRRAMWDPSEPIAPPQSTRVVFRDADRIVALDPPFAGNRAEFVRSNDGGIAWLRWDGRIARPSG